jgi:hypothetical protein
MGKRMKDGTSETVGGNHVSPVSHRWGQACWARVAAAIQMTMTSVQSASENERCKGD